MHRKNGSVLLALIGALVIVSLLGAAVVSLLSSSTEQEVRSKYSKQAYYLAESGFRFAKAKINTEDLDYPYEYSSDSDSDYNGPSKFVLHISKPIPNRIPNAFTVLGNQTMSSGEDLKIKNAKSELPESNGVFEIHGDRYFYQKYDSEQDQLDKIVSLDYKSFNETFTNGTQPDILAVASINSTGHYPSSGYLKVQRTVNYTWPLPASGSGGGPLREFNATDFPGGQAPEYKYGSSTLNVEF